MLFKWLKKKKYPCERCRHCFMLSGSVYWCNKKKHQLIGYIEKCDEQERMKR